MEEPEPWAFSTLVRPPAAGRVPLAGAPVARPGVPVIGAPGRLTGDLAPARPPRSRRRLFVVVAVLLVLFAMVSVRAVRALGAAATGEVGPPVAGAGWAAQFSGADGSVGRWEGCHPVDLVVDARQAPAGGLADLDEAVRRLAAATGLQLRILGPSVERPVSHRATLQPARYGDRWAPVLVSWVDPATTDLPFGATTLGLTEAVAVPVGHTAQIVTAQVALDATQVLKPGFSGQGSEGQLLLHELGHALGLAHADVPGSVMNPDAGQGGSTFTAGDLAGLAAVGANGTCGSVPRPQLLHLNDRAHQG